MSRQAFRNLSECLLRAGVAPRHVSRYVGELEDHLDDLVGALRDRGVEQSLAESEARALLGSDEQLAKVMLEKPELRSIAARMPYLVFGLGPVATPVLVVLVATLLEGGFLKLHLELARLWTEGHPIAPAWLKLGVNGWIWIVTYAAPLAIAAFFLSIGIRQRMATHWMLLGVGVAAFIGAFHEVGAHWSDLPGQSELSVGFGLAPPFAFGINRVLANMAIAAFGTWLWIGRHRPVCD